MAAHDRLLIDDSIQQRWEFFEPATFDMMLKAWHGVRRYLAKERAFGIQEEPVLRATMHYEDLDNVLRTWDRQQMLVAPPNLGGSEYRLNGMLLAPTREATPGHVVIELLGISRAR